jgi:hypothetical protein
MPDIAKDGEPAHEPTSDQPAAIPTATATVPIANPTPPPVPRSKLAQAALVLGIVAVVCAMIPILNAVAVLAGLGAIVCGGLALKKKTAHRRGSIAGLSLGAVALIIAMVVSSAAAGGNTSPEPAAQKSGTSATQPSETPAAKSEPPKPTPTPTEASPTEEAAPPAPVVPADKVYQGSGDSVVAVELPDGADQVSVATISHIGSHNFAVWALDSNMEQHDLMVNEIGNYQGTVLFNLQGSNTTSLQVTATGPWTITLRSIKSLRAFEGVSATGTGDDVLIYLGKAGAATISHDGQHNFAVWTYGDRSDLVVNEIGAYNGTVRWSAGPSVVAVSADGNWSIKLG